MNTTSIPKTGFEGFKAHFKDDLISGFSVSLIALPLCLGIAIASGVPPLAGLITAIIGGIVASRISGSFVTISGPAAGLIVITLGAAEAMGGAGAESGYAGYPHALGAIVIGGVIMGLFGLLKVGKVGDYFPSSAVHGMLAAIGVIIIIKQIFPALGVVSPKGEILEVATDIPHAFTEMSLPSVIISAITLLILIVHPLLKLKFIKMIPAPMWVLIFTIPIAYQIGHEHFFLVKISGTEHLSMVKMPHNLFGKGGIHFPSFEKIGESAFWVAVVGVALVSAIESLLSAKAVDSLDPYKRKSNLDKDLMAMGFGSSLAALVGGLPMISEIVRSSANVNNGAKTQWANFFHGTFLLIYFLVAVSIIEMIPIPALSAMLVFTGYKLAHPREFVHMAKIGKTEIIVFVITLIAVLASDLIIGIIIGIIVTYIFTLAKGNPVKNLFRANANIQGDTIKLEGYLTFSNFLSLKKKLDAALAANNAITLDFAQVTFVDHTVIHHLEDYERDAVVAGKRVNTINMEGLNPETNHSLAARSRKYAAPAVQTVATNRGAELEAFAKENGYSFEVETSDFEDWDFYHLTIRHKIVSIKRLITIIEGAVTYTVADVKTKSGELSTEDFDKQTVVKISGLPSVPKFYMHKADFVDKLKDALGKDDIDFESNPEFSNNYVLRSDGMETEVRAMFTDALMAHINANGSHFMSGNGKDLLLHFDDKLLSVDEIKQLIDAAKQLVKLLNY